MRIHVTVPADRALHLLHYRRALRRAIAFASRDIGRKPAMDEDIQIAESPRAWLPSTERKAHIGFAIALV
jgi:hypothetical protein